MLEMRQATKWVRIAAFVTCYAALFWLGRYSGNWLVQIFGLDPSKGNLVATSGATWAALVAYAVLLAVPFVPGMEISIALFAMFGSAVALPVYGATLASLTTAFLVGRMVPAAFVSFLFRSVGSRLGDDFVQRVAPLDANARMAMLLEAAPSRIVPFLLRHRYIAIAIAFNVPGNAALGGGGGIALIAGMSGLFSLPGYVLAVSIAILPVPLAAFLGGKLF